MRKFRLNKKQLENLYWKKQLSLPKISKILKVSQSTIKYWMKKYDIPRRTISQATKGINTWSRKFNLTKRQLEKLYWDDKLSLSKISMRMRVSENNIIYWMKRYNIPRRTLSESLKGMSHPMYGKPAPNRKFNLSKKELEKLYIIDNLNCEQISKKTNVSALTVSKWLRRCKIPRRVPIEKMRELWKDPEYRKEIGKKVRQSHQNPLYIKKMIESLNVKPNKQELMVDSLIRIFYNDYPYNGDYSQGVSIGGKIPDWINVNGQKKVIELFGRTFHDPKYVFNNRKIPYSQTYEGTMEHYKKYGFDCLIIWDYELKNPGRVLEKICDFDGR